MKLHTGMGPNPRVVKMFIAEKGLDIPRVDVDLLAGDNRKPPYTDKNPAGQLPCLELEEDRYLAEQWALGRSWQELAVELDDKPDALRMRLSRVLDRLSAEFGLSRIE